MEPNDTMTTPNRSCSPAASDEATTVDPDGPPNLPHVFTDAADRAILVDRYDEDDVAALIEMYEAFDPIHRAQGLPPVGEPNIRDWLDGVLRGVSILAWHENDPIGHAMFIPDGNGGHELAVFVRGAYHDAGIGSTLLRTGLEYLRSTGGQRVWLAVSRGNDPARHLYQKLGFTVDDSCHLELEMSRDL